VIALSAAIEFQQGMAEATAISCRYGGLCSVWPAPGRPDRSMVTIFTGWREYRRPPLRRKRLLAASWYRAVHEAVTGRLKATLAISAAYPRTSNALFRR